MGFMSLFSKKGRHDKQLGGRSPKAQPYESTVASLPPTRGAYPVAGNGPGVMQTLSKSPRFTQSQFSLTEASAPSPTVPRFKDEDLGVDRPRTAPGGGRGMRPDGGMDQPQKRTSTKPPPVSLRPQSRGDSLVSAPQAAAPIMMAARRTTENALKPLPATPRGPFSHTPHAHSRTFSLRSDLSKGFVDLLDAQSEINPTDFRSRVKAAGARDYGEDVAERNIGQNGVDLQSSHVQAFYAGDAQGPAQGLTEEPPRTPIETSRAGPRRLNGAKSGPDSGLRTMSLNSSHAFAFPQRTSSALPAQPRTAPTQNTQANTSRPVTGVTSRAMRRQSLNTYLHSPDSEVMSIPQFKSRPMSYHRGPASADQRLQISATRANRHAPGWDTTSPETDNISPPLPPPRGARDPVLVIQNGPSTEKPALVPTDRFQFQFESQQDAQPASVPRPWSSRGSVASSSFAPHHGPGSKKGSSLHTIHSSISSSMTYRETPADFTPLAHPKPPRRGSKTAEDVDAAAVGRGRDTQPTYTTSSPWRGEARDEVHRYPRTKSLTSLPRPPFDELEDIPPRSSSIRNWSMTSATPTTSSTSSHTFPRSAHTANTSVDLSNAYPSGRPSSRSSANSAFGRQSFCTAPESRKVTSPGFNIDDYLSSDDDAFDVPRRSRAEGEEALLFKVGGYGMSASQLPGLLDGMSAPAPEIRSHRPRSSASLPAERLRLSFAHPVMNGGGARRRRYGVDPGLVDDYYYDNDPYEAYSASGRDDALSSVIPGLPDGTGQDGRRHTRRISALGGHRGHGRYDSFSGDVIEEERLEKIDINTAVRMRKEAKAKKRALLTDRNRVESPYRAAAKGKAVARDSGDPDDADIEQ